MEIIIHQRTNASPTNTQLLKQLELGINEFIGNGNFPKKIEFKRIRMTSKYYGAKIDQHKKLIQEAQSQIQDIHIKKEQIIMENSKLLNRIRSIKD